MTRLSGRVPESGTAVQGATVAIIDTQGVEDPSQWSVVAFDTTDANGEWSVSGLDPSAVERYHAVAQYDDGSSFTNFESLPYLSTPADVFAPQTTLNIGTPTPSVSVGSAIPDSAIAQYDATQESYSDGESISAITDQIGTADMTGGSGEYNATGIGGNASYDLQGFSGVFSAGGDLVIQDSYTILTVVDLVDDSSQSRILDRDTGDFVLYWDDGVNWKHIPPSGAGSSAVGSTNASKQLIGATKDGSTVTIREDGAETGSISDAATGSSSEPVIQGGDPWNGLIGELIFYNPVLSQSELESEEQRLADKWGISI